MSKSEDTIEVPRELFLRMQWYVETANIDFFNKKHLQEWREELEAIRTLLNPPPDQEPTFTADGHPLLQALHDAINSPKGVVPDSALEFYDPKKFYGEHEPEEDPRQMHMEL
jgi:hypothetical protein